MIFTCTTIPPRMRFLPAFFANLARQRLKPEAVELYVAKSYRRFPGEVPALPALPDWVNVITLEEDMGPATKVLPAARTWRGKDVDILFGDDDRRYDPLWTKRFADMRSKVADEVICETGTLLPEWGLPATGPADLPRPVKPSRWHKRAYLAKRALTLAMYRPTRRGYITPGYVDIFEGQMGVMVRPDWFDEATYDIPPVLWTVDDVWLSGSLARQGFKIRTTDEPHKPSAMKGPHNANPLLTFKLNGVGRHEANIRCIEYFQTTYGIWLPTDQAA
jgi:hypothetical protein